MNRKQGFTLIELMVVMVILAILMAIGTGAFTSSMIKGRDNTRKANLRAITSALELYYNDKGKYPTGASGTFSSCYSTLTGTVVGSCGKDNPVFRDSPTTGAMYMAKFPVDPVSSLKYYYVSATGSQFQIYAHLENSQDPAINPTIISESINCDNAAGTTLCNYGVSSANINP
ncbi:MAG: prepilin-type N-terminal cleavage/methylation domain-containing protein [Candidatus Gottesmanbacteria bacterium]|nr:prepilin-type N-terminal cleavage/methylation domain-containing protein [Candidatus Gottesmanbacteria bacterium]